MPETGSSVRQPSLCPHREAVGGGYACRLVQLLAEMPQIETCIVREDACRTCCEIAPPSECDPNSVVASLAHAILGRRFVAEADVQTTRQLAERMVWIERFLDTDWKDERPVGPRLPRRRSWSRSWRQWLGRPPRLGLVGPNNLQGLGHQNRDLARELSIEHWLLPIGDARDCEDARRFAKAATLATDEPRRLEMVSRFLDDIDVLLFVETPFFSPLPLMARRRGIPVVLVPNWERLHPGMVWLREVDGVLCPTEFTRRMMVEWQRRFHFRWNITAVTWPINADAFPFQRRHQCRRFVYINGADTGYPRDRQGRPTSIRRKGLEALVAAAWRLPHIPFVVWSQVDSLPELPANVELRMSAGSNSELYRDGDVCVQPSRWEGLGFALLECQAAGMPLITTDAGPMNEYRPLDLIRVPDWEVVELIRHRWIPAPQIDDREVARILGAWYGRDISDASEAARRFVEREHSWPAFHRTFWPWLNELSAGVAARIADE